MIGYAGVIIKIDLEELKITTSPSTEYISTEGECGCGYDVLFRTDGGKVANPSFDMLVFACPTITDSLILKYKDAVRKISIHPAQYPLKNSQEDIELKEMEVYWGRELRYAGYDAILFTGKAKAPVYIYINDDRIEIKPASALWHLDAHETKQNLFSVLKTKCIKVLSASSCNFANYNGNMNEEEAKNAEAKKLFDQQMLSKNIKAIAVKGNRRWSKRYQRYIRI